MEKNNIMIIGGAIVVGVGMYFMMGGPKQGQVLGVSTADTAKTSINSIETSTTTNTTTTTNDIKTKEITTKLNTTKTMTQVTELKIEDELVGTGAEAKAGDTVTVHYVGTLLDGTVFDASKNHGNSGFTFSLGAGQVIKGWDVGVAGMKEGGKRKLTIPSDMAYGNQAVGGVIPSNSALIFEVELLKVGK